MSPVAIAALGLVAMLALLVIRMPVAIAMLLVGIVGYVSLHSMDSLLAYMNTAAFWRFNSYDFSVIPLFLLMGQFAAHSTLTSRLFDAANTFLGHRRGGVAMAAVGGCGAFGAICGSSLATVGTMARVALPELKRYNYSGALAAGALAAGGTLGILIPPSVALIIFAVMVEGNIVKMFQAAFIPGILALVGYLITIWIYVRVSPESGPVGAQSTTKEKVDAIFQTWPTLLLFVVVIGGIYLGFFDPTEAAALGALGAGILAFWQGGLDRHGFIQSLIGAAVSTGMIFMILLGADFLNIFLVLSGFPDAVSAFVASTGWNPYLILFVMIVFYLVLGCLMDSLAMIFLTVPVFWPVVAALDFGLSPSDLQIWFGVLVLIVIELGLITPPVGINVLILQQEAKEISLKDAFIGVSPFLLSGLIRVLLLIIFPAIALWLPKVLA